MSVPPRRFRLPLPFLPAALCVALALSGCGGDSGDPGGPVPTRASAPKGKLPEAPVFASKDGELHLKVKATGVRGEIGDRVYDGLQTYETELVDDKGTYTPGTASPYVGPTWRIQPGDEVVIDYVNDLPDNSFTPVATDESEAIPQPMNLHTHGLTVAPNGNSDNVLLSIPPGRSNRFTFEIPEDQYHGLYWYHPHIHGLTDDLVYSGLAGQIVVGRADGDYEEFDDLKVREMMVRYNVRLPGDEGQLIDASPWNTKGTALEPRGEMVYTVNGRVAPEVGLNPADPEEGTEAESQVWALTNVTGSASYILALEEVDAADARDRKVVGEPVDFSIVSIDGTPLDEPKVLTGKAARRGYLLGQGGRVAILVEGASDPSKVVRLIQVENRSGTGDKSAYDWPNRQFGGGWRDYSRDVLAVSAADPESPGEHVDRPGSLTLSYEAEKPRFEDAEVEYRRTFIYNGVAEPSEVTPNNFPIDDELFPGNRVEQPRAGTVEEWTILNYSSLHHPFHVHTQFAQPMRIVAPPGKGLARDDGVFPSIQHVTDMSQDEPAEWTQDLINLPPARVGRDGMPVLGENGKPAEPGIIVLRVKFEDYLGTYVEHCHRLPHEDRGMMSLVRTIPRRPVYATAVGSEVTVHDGATDKPIARRTVPSGVDPAVAIGDVDRDTVPDLAIASTPEGEPGPLTVTVYSGASGWKDAIRELRPFGDDEYAAETSSLALGDLNADGYDEVITGHGPGGSPRVVISNGVDSEQLADFEAYESDHAGGVSVAAGMVEEGGRISLVTGAGPGEGRSKVKVFNFDLFGDADGNMPDPQQVLDPIEAAAFGFGPEGYADGVNVAVGYPFAADGGFASIIASSDAGIDGKGRGRVIVYGLKGHEHGSEDVAVSGVARPAIYEAGGPRRVAQVKQTLSPGRGGFRAAAVSTPSGARVVISGAGGGVYEADGPGTKLKRVAKSGRSQADSLGGI